MSPEAEKNETVETHCGTTATGPKQDSYLISLPLTGPVLSYCYQCSAPAQVRHEFAPAFLRSLTADERDSMRSFYLCSKCEQRKQQARSLTWAQEVSFFTLAFATCTAYFLTRHQVEGASMLTFALLFIIALRILFFCLSAKLTPTQAQQKKSLLSLGFLREITPASRLSFDSAKRSFQLTTSDSEVLRVFTRSDPGASYCQQVQSIRIRELLRKEGALLLTHALFILAWLIALLSTATEIRFYQGTWGTLRILVDQRLMGEVNPSARETAAVSKSLFVWPGYHAISVVDEKGTLLAQLNPQFKTENSYFFAYLAEGRCVSLERFESTPSGMQLHSSFPSPEKNLYILPKIDRWLAPLPTWTPDSAVEQLLSQRDTRHALRITDCR